MQVGELHGSRDGLLCGNQFRFALRRPRNSPAMHSNVSALQTSAWEPSPVLGEAAAGAACAEEGTAVAAGFLPEEEPVLEEGSAVGAVEGSAEGAAEGVGVGVISLPLPPPVSPGALAATA